MKKKECQLFKTMTSELTFQGYLITKEQGIIQRGRIFKIPSYMKTLGDAI